MSLDSKIVSPEIEKILLQVQNKANYMPNSQLNVPLFTYY